MTVFSGYMDQCKFLCDVESCSYQGWSFGRPYCIFTSLWIPPPEKMDIYILEATVA